MREFEFSVWQYENINMCPLVVNANTTSVYEVGMVKSHDAVTIQLNESVKLELADGMFWFQYSALNYRYTYHFADSRRWADCDPTPPTPPESISTAVESTSMTVDTTLDATVEESSGSQASEVAIGVGVGLTVVCLCITLAMGVFCYRSRREKRHCGSNTVTNVNSDSEPTFNSSVSVTVLQRSESTVLAFDAVDDNNTFGFGEQISI
jgi:hypothetical protein